MTLRFFIKVLKRKKKLINNPSQEIEDLKKKVDSLEAEQKPLSEKLEKFQFPIGLASIRDPITYAHNIIAHARRAIFKREIYKIENKTDELKTRISELEAYDLFKEKNMIKKLIADHRMTHPFFHDEIRRDEIFSIALLKEDCFWQAIVFYYLDCRLFIKTNSSIYTLGKWKLIDKLEELLKLLIWRISNTKQMLEGLDEAEKQEAKLLIGQFSLAKDYMQNILIKLQDDSDDSNND